MRFSFYLSVTETILHSVYRLGNIVLLFFFKYREMYWNDIYFSENSKRAIHEFHDSFDNYYFFVSFFFFFSIDSKSWRRRRKKLFFPSYLFTLLFVSTRCRVPWKYSTPRRSGKVIKFNLLKRSKYINLQFTRKLYIEAVQRVFQRHKEERFLRVFSALRR